MGDWDWGRRDSPQLERDRERFGHWIYEARRVRGMTQARFGAIVGLHQSTISRLERGLVRYLRFETVLRLLLVILEATSARRSTAA